MIVIECKARGRSFRRADAQIITYMTDGNYPHGLLVYPDNTRAYIMSDDEPNIIRLYSYKDELKELLLFVRSI